MPAQYFDEDATPLPNKQRFKDSMMGRGNRLNIFPKRDFFSCSEHHQLDLHRVNSALHLLVEPLPLPKETVSCFVEVQDNPPETCSVGVQTEHCDILNSCDLEPYDGFILMKCNKITVNEKPLTGPKFRLHDWALGP